MSAPSDPSRDVAPTQRRRRVVLFTGVTLLALAATWAFMAWIVPPIRAARNERNCKSNLKRIGAALYQYHDKHGKFPPAYVLGENGERWHSWRVLLLPHLGNQALYDEYRFDEPWNGPHNQQLIRKMPSVFGCPAANSDHAEITNYLAVVGTETVWPEHFSCSVEDITDPNSQTIMVLEKATSSIHWTEPLDLSFREAKVGVSVQHSSGEKSGCHVLRADGSVRFYHQSVLTPDVLRSLLTRSNGTPYPGLPRSTADGGEIAVKPSAEWPRTQVTSYLAADHELGRNLAYCATFQIAWDELRDGVFRAPVQLADDPVMARQLNRDSFPLGALSPESYIALAGRSNPAFAAKLQNEFKRKFPGQSPAFTIPDNELIITIYSALRKSLRFDTPFDRLESALVFYGQDGMWNITAFGCNAVEEPTPLSKQIRAQVTVKDYTSDNDFILTLKTLSDTITLAKIKPAATLAATVEQVLQRQAKPNGASVRPAMETSDLLQVPLLRLGVVRRFDEIVGKHFLNPGWEDGFIHEARQIIKFQLDEAGAILESDVELGSIANGHEVPVPPPPRHFVFNKSFLLLLQEPKADRPYFALWIENDELCVPFRASK